MAGGNKSWTWTTRANCFISYYACLAHIAETRQSLDQMTQPLSFHTQHAMLVPLRGWFRWMTRKNHVLHNPASELELPRLGHHLPKHVLNVDEVEQVLRQPNLSDPMGVRDRAILETLYSAGMRRGECVQLNIRQLKLVHGHTHPAEQQPDSAAAKEGDARARAELLGRRSMLKGRKMSSDIIPFMAKHVVHISEAEAASNFVGVLARVRAGIEVVIGDEVRPVAVVRPAEPHVRLLSESLRLAKEHASTATLDEDFARDLEAAINSHREPLNPPAWD